MHVLMYPQKKTRHPYFLIYKKQETIELLFVVFQKGRFYEDEVYLFLKLLLYFCIFLLCFLTVPYTCFCGIFYFHFHRLFYLNTKCYNIFNNNLTISCVCAIH